MRVGHHRHGFPESGRDQRAFRRPRNHGPRRVLALWPICWRTSRR
jgi:hypothetical protein